VFAPSLPASPPVGAQPVAPVRAPDIRPRRRRRPRAECYALGAAGGAANLRHKQNAPTALEIGVRGLPAHLYSYNARQRQKVNRPSQK